MAAPIFLNYFEYNTTQAIRNCCEGAIKMGQRFEDRGSRLPSIQQSIQTKLGGQVCVVESTNPYQWAPGVTWCYIVGYGKWVYNINAYA